MTQQINDQFKPDALIVGSGLAGLLLALELSASGSRVMVATKGSLFDSNTAWAQGGLAAVTPLAFADSPELHLQDTIKAGAGLTDPAIASLVVKEGAALVDRLTELGMEFDNNGSGTPVLALEGGHSRPRVLHSKDTTGSAITQSLTDRITSDPNVLVFENTLAADLITSDGNCIGARLLVGREPISVYAAQVVLATGGIGQVFERTTNPLVATGDGIAMAWRAGAVLADLEFVQFHPTALFKPGAPAFLISEAVRGAGGILVDAEGRRFARRFHPDGELSTRDVVARAINTVMQEQSLPCVWLDMRPIGGESISARFPNIIANCRRWGIDPLDEPIPVSPAAHYFMGGIWTNANGCTTLPGLYAIGECASVGLHGANRLASNSLLEAGVMALRVARHIARAGLASPAARSVSAPPETERQLPSDLLMFRRMMYRHAGVERDAAGLASLFEFLSESVVIRRADSNAEFESANMLLIGQLIALSALARQESRGAHWRSDFPQQDDRQFCRRQYICRNDVEGSFAPAKPRLLVFPVVPVAESVRP